MIFNHQYFTYCSFILITTLLSLSTATFCSNLTSTDDKDTPCFLESPTPNPSRLRSSGNSLILPCHVARSKRSTVEWWYQDFQKLINIKIYPVFPAVRPTVLRFITSHSLTAKTSNETDIMDVSVLLRNVNIDDSGIYRCVVRPWTSTNTNNMYDSFLEDDSDLPVLTYHVELSGPRVCQTSFGALPCFQNMRTSSPTVVDAYQTAFLQCVVQNHNRPARVFWVVGNATGNSVLITDYLSTNKHNGDRIRRVFALSPFDYSVELTINRDTYERSYSCVIAGSTDAETTLFTYIVRSIDLQGIPDETIKARKNETTTPTTELETEKSSKNLDKIISHDTLTPDQVEELRHKISSHEHTESTTEKLDQDDEDSLELFGREESPTKKLTETKN
jgi:hypothetical protein